MISARELGVFSRLRLHGAVSDPTALASLYGDSLVSVSPGPVGLALTQSLSYGVPMIISNDEAHGPEIELAATENCFWFQSGSPESLGRTLLESFDIREDLISRGPRISSTAASTYSIEAMASAFKKVIFEGA
jgi:glycosyltransferase involved in cell wall biosynthesis